MSKYPDSGIINKAQEKRSDKSPDYWGYGDLSIGLIKQLLVQAEQNGGNARIKMGGWIKQGQRGSFISVKFTEAESDPQRGGGSGGGGGYQRPPNPTQTRPVRGKPVDLDDEIPF